MAQEVKLIGGEIRDKAALFQSLREQLTLEEWYGNNLDALADALTEPEAEVTFTVAERETLLENLGGYGEAFLEMLSDAAGENEGIRVVFPEEAVPEEMYEDENFINEGCMTDSPEE